MNHLSSENAELFYHHILLP